VAMARPKNLRDVLTRATTKVPAHIDFDRLTTNILQETETNIHLIEQKIHP